MEKTFQPNFLNGKTAFITGGATGICYVITKTLAQYGCKVCIMSRKQEAISKAVDSLKKETNSEHVYGHTGDVRKISDIETAVNYFLEKCGGKIDILVNGAAGNFLAPLSQLSAGGFKTVIDIDLLGTYNTTKVVFEKSMKQHGGNIINISAAQAYVGVALQSHAGAAKAGIDNLTKSLAVELGPRNIRVNGVVPGAIEGTEGMSKLSKGQDTNQKMETYFPIQRMGTKQDISSAILFLVSDAASYVTGQNLIVDGGSLQCFPNFPLIAPEIKKMWNQAKL